MRRLVISALSIFLVCMHPSDATSFSSPKHEKKPNFCARAVQNIFEGVYGGPLDLRPDLLKYIAQNLKGPESFSDGTSFDFRKIDLAERLQKIYELLKSKADRKKFRQTFMPKLSKGNKSLKPEDVSLLSAVAASATDLEMMKKWAAKISETPQEMLYHIYNFSNALIGRWDAREHFKIITQYNQLMFATVPYSTDSADYLGSYSVRIAQNGAIVPFGFSSERTSVFHLKPVNKFGPITFVLYPQELKDSYQAFAHTISSLSDYLDSVANKDQIRIRPLVFQSKSTAVLSRANPVVSPDTLFSVSGRLSNMTDFYLSLQAQLRETFLALMNSAEPEKKATIKQYFDRSQLFRDLSRATPSSLFSEISNWLNLPDFLPQLDFRAFSNTRRVNRSDNPVRDINLRQLNQLMMDRAYDFIRPENMSDDDRNEFKAVEIALLVSRDGSILYVGLDADFIHRTPDQFIFRMTIGKNLKAKRYSFEVLSIVDPLQVSSINYGDSRASAYNMAREITLRLNNLIDTPQDPLK